jgi:hypothetical protein
MLISLVSKAKYLELQNILMIWFEFIQKIHLTFSNLAQKKKKTEQVRQKCISYQYLQFSLLQYILYIKE